DALLDDEVSDGDDHGAARYPKRDEQPIHATCIYTSRVIEQGFFHMSDLVFRSAWELAYAIRHGELSPEKLVQACLDRIDALNPTLNAFVAVRREEALEEAAALQRAIVAGKRLGPLAGLPVGVKDLEDVAGLPTTYGSVPFKDYRPVKDSVQVARLRAAG